MLVRFTSSTSGEIVMLAETARRLLDVVGKERTARGVFTTEQLQEAIDRLRAAVAEEKAATARQGAGGEDGDDDDEEADAASGPKGGRGIGLAQRAHPLIEMLGWTLKEKGYVTWEAKSDF